MQKSVQLLNPGQSFIKSNTLSRSRITIEIITALFIVLFLYTAIDKSLHIKETVDALKQSPLFSSYPVEVAWLVVIMEYVASILLFIHSTRKLGLYLSLFMMLAFTGYIAYIKVFIPKLPCSCGGVISSMTWNQHLFFNTLFAFLAATAIILLRKQTARR